MDKREKSDKLLVANKKNIFQNQEKDKRAAELSIANSNLLKAHERIININRLYSFISHTNQTIVHVKDEQTLFNDACSIAVNQGKFKMAWIGIVDTAARKIKLAASCAESEADLSILSDYNYISKEPIKKTLSGSNYVLIRDLQKELEIPRNKHTNEWGIRSSICLPIKKSGKVIGVFSLYSSETDFFDTDEINMLVEAANDISFAVTLFDDRRQKKIVQQKLERSQVRLKEAQTLGHIGNWEVNLVSSIHKWAGEFYNIFGIKREDVTPSPESFLSLLHPDDVSYARKKLAKIFQTNEAGHFNARFINKEGSIRYIYCVCKFKFDKKKKPVRLYGIIQDITEIKQAEETLRKSESNLQTIFDNTSEGFILIDINGIVKTFNKKIAQTIFLNTEQEIKIGSSIYDFIYPPRQKSYKSILSKVMAGETIQYDYSFERKNSDIKWFSFTINLAYDKEGEIDGICIKSTDITERKLADNKNRFRANLLNTIGQAAIATDLNGVVNYWNKAAENIYGWTLEDAMGMNIIDLTASEATNEQAIQIMEELKKGRTWSGEFRARKKDGTNFPAMITNSLIYDEHHILSGIIGISSDITEKKKLEALLDKSNRLALLGSWEIDVDKGTVFWSDITKEIREADKDYVPHRDVEISYYKEGIHQETITQKVQECIENGTPWDEELQIITFKGNLKWVRTIGEAEFFNGKCKKVYGSFQDITARKESEQSLQQSQSNLKAIIENTDATIYSLDTEFRYIAFNKSLYDNLKQLYGLDIKIGDNAYSFLNKLEPNEAKGWKEIYTKVLKGETIKFEKEFNIGEFHNYSSFSLYPILVNKTIVGLSCFINNITEQKQEQKQKEKMSADLIQRNLDLEQFTFIISHNLRAPAANIIACAEILQDETITPQEQKDLLHGIYKSVTALDAVIKDINKILQVKSEVNEKKEVIIFSKLVNDIMISISNLIDKHHVRIISDFSEVDEIYSLKIYIYSIFYNLISNSIKYSKLDEQALIEIKSKKENDKTILTFKDNGLGIDMKTKGDKIFGLYKRFHTHVEGKGMGLFMVKTQVESLGGKITIASELNKGTEFTIVFTNLK